MITAREFHGDEFYLKWLAELESMRAFRNKMSTKGNIPDKWDIVLLKLNKPFEKHLAAILDI